MAKASAPNSPAEAAPAPPLPRCVRIVLAEGDADRRARHRLELSGFGHNVVADVGEGEQALSAAREQTPDMLLLDADLPGPTTAVLARAVAAELPRMSIILLGDEPPTSLGELESMRTSTFAFLPRSTPTCALDATVRLTASRARELRSAEDEVSALRQQLENRKTIERAKGILMRRTGLTEAEAYRILQRTSQDRSVPMVAVAAEVLASEPAR